MKKISIAMSIVMGALITLSFDYSPAETLASEQQILNYLEAHGLESISKQSLLQAAAPLAPPPTNEHCITCDEISYCGLETADLLQYIDNYRDEVWRKTSPYFDTNPYTEDVLFTGSASEENGFDARFMDMDIAQLENYICTIKNSTIAPDVNTIRFYYIRYNEDSAPIANFEWKHSLAMVPVTLNAEGLTQTEHLQSLVRTDGTYWSLAVDVNNFCANTPMANHTVICPPYVGCADNTLLQTADTN